MSDLKRVWRIFKDSSMQDKDMQKAFERAVTPNACIEILEENEKLLLENAKFKQRLYEHNCRLIGAPVPQQRSDSK